MEGWINSPQCSLILQCGPPVNNTTIKITWWTHLSVFKSSNILVHSFMKVWLRIDSKDLCDDDGLWTSTEFQPSLTYWVSLTMRLPQMDFTWTQSFATFVYFDVTTSVRSLLSLSKRNMYTNLGDLCYACALILLGMKAVSALSAFWMIQKSSSIARQIRTLHNNRAVSPLGHTSRNISVITRCAVLDVRTFGWK